MMPSATYMKIRDAILQKLVVSADYDRHHREMCPHTLGMKHGREHALYYQFGGTSKRGLGPDGSPQNWRCVDIASCRRARHVKGNGIRHLSSPVRRPAWTISTLRSVAKPTRLSKQRTPEPFPWLLAPRKSTRILGRRFRSLSLQHASLRDSDGL